MELNYVNLEQLISKLGYSVSFQKETGQLVMIFKAEPVEYPVFLRIIQRDALLHIVMFLPCKVEEKTLSDTLLLLNFFNREIEIPGFCYDDISKLIFYRIVLPTIDYSIVSMLIEKIFKVFPSIANTLTPITQLVCNGTKTYNDIKKDFNKTSKRPS